MRFLLFAHLLASLLVTVFASNIDIVKADIDDLKTKLARVEDDIRGVPENGGILVVAAAALEIRADADSAIAAISKATVDVKGLTTPVSRGDGTVLLQSAQELLPGIISVLGALTAKRSTFQVIVSNIRKDLTTVNINTEALLDALISACPPEILKDALSMRAQIEAALSRAIAVYS